MAARLLLGIIAALRAVLVPGQADLLASQPLSWPKLSFPRMLAGAPGDPREVVVKTPAV